MVRLYGVGAVQFDHNGGVYRPQNGVLDVPADLVPRAMQFGFSPVPPDPAPATESVVTEPEIPADAAPAAPVADAKTPESKAKESGKPKRGG